MGGSSRQTKEHKLYVYHGQHEDTKYRQIGYKDIRSVIQTHQCLIVHVIHNTIKHYKQYGLYIHKTS